MPLGRKCVAGSADFFAIKNLLGLFDFLVRRVLSALLAVFFQLNFRLDCLLVAARIVIHRAAFGALEFDHVIL